MPPKFLRYLALSRQLIRESKVKFFGKFLYRRVFINSKRPRQNQFDALPRSLEILAPFFGISHANMFVSCCLPSLLQSGISHLCLRVPTQLSVFCPNKEWELISNQVSIVVGDLPIFIKWYLPDESSNISKNSLMNFVRSRVKSSLDGDSAKIFAFPDLIFGRGLDKLITNSSRGQYIVCAQIRTPFESGSNFYRKVIKENTYTNSDLIKYALTKHIHPQVRAALDEPSDYSRLENHGDTYLYYFSEPPPILLRGSEVEFESVFRKPFFGKNSLLQCIDHDIVNLMLRKGRLRAVNDSQYFCILELTSESEYVEKIRSSFNLESALYFRSSPVRLVANSCKV